MYKLFLRLLRIGEKSAGDLKHRTQVHSNAYEDLSTESTHKSPFALEFPKKSIAIFIAFSIIASLLLFNTQKLMGQTMMIPREKLFALPDRSLVKISPNGKFISYLAKFDGVQNIIVSPTSDLSATKRITFESKSSVGAYKWLFEDNFIIYSKDTDGDENDILYLINIETLETEQITEKGRKAYAAMMSIDKPSEIVYMINDRNPSYFDAYLYNIHTKTKKMLFQNDVYISLDFDSNLNMRFGTKVAEDGSYEIYQFQPHNTDPKLFFSIPFEDTSTSGIIGLNRRADKLLFVNSVGREFSTLYEADLASDTLKIIGEPLNADISGVHVHPETLDVDSFAYTYDKVRHVFLNDKVGALFNFLQSELDGEVEIISRSKDDKFWIVSNEKDDGPLEYYFFDGKKLEFLFVHNQKLLELPLNKMHPVEIKSRDGLTLMSYLSLPVDTLQQDVLRPQNPIPLVLYVHGGPNARDFWGYNSVHQWLTNRGYAVLSVNYRGSTGFGKSFIRAGDGQWAAKMHDDLLDAVSWAIDKGITTQDKVAIFGGSYGGYATLVGLTMTPETFACGVDIVGPSNLKTLYESIPPYWEPFKHSLRAKFGFDPQNKEHDEILKSKSPIFHVQNITKPVLIAHGANDPRVKQAESDQIIDKLDELGIKYTYLLYPDEGHGFKKEYNRISFFGFAEKFLASCFDIPKYEVLSDAELAHTTAQIKTNITE